MFKKIENEENLLKDSYTGAVVETDINGALKYKELKESKRKLNNKIAMMENKIDNLEKMVAEILKLVSKE
jgi:predicted transcriptional regulator